MAQVNPLPYRLGEEVARGGTGVVYRATMNDGRPAAVKQLAAKYSDEKLFHEASLLARLEHPNIVQFYGVHKMKRGGIALAMEWVGPSLSRLRRSGKVPLGVAVYIICELLRALEYLQKEGDLHRDLSPRNVLLSEAGDVKLIDFGLSTTENAPRTTGGVKGTPPYFSLEQFGDGKLDGRSDLFVLGVVFYELLTGTPPFSSSSELKHRPPIANVSALRPGIPRKLDSIIAKLLQYERTNRFSSASEVLAELMKVAPDREIGRLDLAQLLRERGLVAGATATRSRRWLIGGAAAAVLFVGVVLGAGSVYLHGASSSWAPGEAQTAADEAVREVLDSAGKRKTWNPKPSPLPRDAVPAEAHLHAVTATEKRQVTTSDGKHRRAVQPSTRKRASRKAAEQPPVQARPATPPPAEQRATQRYNPPGPRPGEAERHNLPLGEVVIHGRPGSAVFFHDQNDKAAPADGANGETQ